MTSVKNQVLNCNCSQIFIFIDLFFHINVYIYIQKSIISRDFEFRVDPPTTKEVSRTISIKMYFNETLSFAKEVGTKENYHPVSPKRNDDRKRGVSMTTAFTGKLLCSHLGTRFHTYLFLHEGYSANVFL